MAVISYFLLLGTATGVALGLYFGLRVAKII